MKQKNIVFCGHGGRGQLPLKSTRFTLEKHRLYPGKTPAIPGGGRLEAIPGVLHQVLLFFFRPPSTYSFQYPLLYNSMYAMSHFVEFVKSATYFCAVLSQDNYPELDFSCFR